MQKNCPGGVPTVYPWQTELGLNDQITPACYLQKGESTTVYCQGIWSSGGSLFVDLDGDPNNSQNGFPAGCVLFEVRYDSGKKPQLPKDNQLVPNQTFQACSVNVIHNQLDDRVVVLARMNNPTDPHQCPNNPMRIQVDPNGADVGGKSQKWIIK